MMEFQTCFVCQHGPQQRARWSHPEGEKDRSARTSWNKERRDREKYPKLRGRRSHTTNLFHDVHRQQNAQIKWKWLVIFSVDTRIAFCKRFKFIWIWEYKTYNNFKDKVGNILYFLLSTNPTNILKPILYPSVSLYFLSFPACLWHLVTKALIPTRQNL